MVLYTGFNGEVNKKLMVNYTTITCLCFHDNYMPPRKRPLKYNPLMVLYTGFNGEVEING